MIRLARPEDDAVLGELQVAAYTSQYAVKLPELVMPPQRLADLRNHADKRQHGSVFVYEQNGQIAGTIALFRFESPRSEAWIAGAATLRYLAVAPACHGQGLSRDLMDAAEREARRWGAPAVCLHVRQECDGLARLYMARGYVRDDRGDQDHRPVVFLDGYVLHFASEVAGPS
jgi:GNAT superfamily N-acetyltransferase